MKPGDLVKLVLTATARCVETFVPVVWDLDGWATALRTATAGRRSDATRFPEGTAAVFLSPANVECVVGMLDTCILIEGRVGWVWSKYLEVV